MTKWIVLGIFIIVIILLIVYRGKIISAGKRIITYVEMEKTWDLKTDVTITGLHPKIRKRATQLVNNLKAKGIKLRIYSGLRSIEEQKDIYAKGRDSAGNIIDKSKVVSNAPPYASFHQYGLAFDSVEIKNGKALWSNPNWETIGIEGEKIGFEWGGYFKKPDRPHFRDKFGYHHTELKDKYLSGDRDGEYVNLV